MLLPAVCCCFTLLLCLSLGLSSLVGLAAAAAPQLGLLLGQVTAVAEVIVAVKV